MLAEYEVTATRGTEHRTFPRPDAPSAFATVRRLRSAGWTVAVKDPFADQAARSRGATVTSVESERPNGFRAAPNAIFTPLEVHLAQGRTS